MNKTFVYGSIALTAVVLGVFHYKLKPKVDEKAVQQYADVVRNRALWRGQIAPDFEVTDMHGQSFHLADNVGKKVIVLNFFATWCGPCREEMPELNRYYAEHKDQSFLLVGIDSEEKPERVSDFLKELKLDFPVVIDQGPVQQQYSVGSFPTTVVIGVDGRVQFYEVGAVANAEVAFDNLLSGNSSLLQSGKAIAPADYAREALAHPKLPSQNPAPPLSGEPKLDARGARIAAAMGCPCGCEKKVQVCSCSTAANIKNALAKEDFKDQTDDAIVKSLNKRFCSGPM